MWVPPTACGCRLSTVAGAAVDLTLPACLQPNRLGMSLALWPPATVPSPVKTFVL